jgi:hypothetical protein
VQASRAANKRRDSVAAARSRPPNTQIMWAKSCHACFLSALPNDSANRLIGHPPKDTLTGVRSRNEVFPLEQAQGAYDRMMSGKARFRVVLTTTG